MYVWSHRRPLQVLFFIFQLRMTPSSSQTFNKTFFRIPRPPSNVPDRSRLTVHSHQRSILDIRTSMLIQECQNLTERFVTRSVHKDTLIDRQEQGHRQDHTEYRTLSRALVRLVRTLGREVPEGVEANGPKLCSMTETLEC